MRGLAEPAPGRGHYWHPNLGSVEEGLREDYVSAPVPPLRPVALGSRSGGYGATDGGPAAGADDDETDPLTN